MYVYSTLIVTFTVILTSCFSTNFVCSCVFYLGNEKQGAKQCLVPFRLRCADDVSSSLCLFFGEILPFEINCFVLFSLLLSLMGPNISPIFFSLARSSG